MPADTIQPAPDFPIDGGSDPRRRRLDHVALGVALFLIFAFVYSALAAEAVPFPQPVALGQSLVLILSMSADEFTRPGVALSAGIAAVAIATTFAFVRTRSPQVRACCLVVLVNPVGVILIAALLFNPTFIVVLAYETVDVLIHPTDGEGWEFMPIFVAAWWAILWTGMAVREIYLVSRFPPPPSRHGFPLDDECEGRMR